MALRFAGNAVATASLIDLAEMPLMQYLSCRISEAPSDTLITCNAFKPIISVALLQLQENLQAC